MPDVPHPQPSPEKLARLDQVLLVQLITISERSLVPADKRHLAGIPEASELRAELRRRELMGQAVSE